jgi:hypothetical protein
MSCLTLNKPLLVDLYCYISLLLLCADACLNRHAISSTDFYWSESKDNKEPFPLASSHNKVLLFGNGLSVFLQQLLSSDFMMTMVHLKSPKDS